MMIDREVRLASQPKRVAAPFSERELAEIDDWGFKRRIRDRSAVIRTLVRHALDAKTSAQVESGGAQ